MTGCQLPVIVKLRLCYKILLQNSRIMADIKRPRNGPPTESNVLLMAAGTEVCTWVKTDAVRNAKLHRIIICPVDNVAPHIADNQRAAVQARKELEAKFHSHIQQFVEDHVEKFLNAGAHVTMQYEGGTTHIEIKLPLSCQVTVKTVHNRQ